MYHNWLTIQKQFANDLFTVHLSFQTIPDTILIVYSKVARNKE